MKPRNFVIPLLFVCHILASVVSWFFAEDDPSIRSQIMLSVAFCQAGILGMWCGLGGTHWVLRLVGTALGVLYLSIVVVSGISARGNYFLFFILVSLATGIVTTITWPIRRFKADLRRVVSTQTNTKEGLQFSIRHLLMLMFAVAALLSVGKILAPHIDFGEDITLAVTFAVCFAAVSLASLWATLGLRYLVLRILFVIFIVMLAVLTEVIMASRQSSGNFDIDFEALRIWGGITVAQAAILLGTLSIFRLTGYRLAAKERRLDNVASPLSVTSSSPTTVPSGDGSEHVEK